MGDPPGGGRDHGDPRHERPRGPACATAGGERRDQHGGLGTSPGSNNERDLGPWGPGALVRKMAEIC